MKTPDMSFMEVLRDERRDLLQRLRETRFTTLKNGISHGQIIPYSTYSPWLDDISFNSVYSMISEHTLVDQYRCYELYQLASRTKAVDGEIVEIGVWRGGTAALLAAALPTKRSHLFDTFTGVAKADPNYDTLYVGGEHADTDAGTVLALFQSMSLSCQVHVGLFPDDTGAQLPEKICFSHIDVDTYKSALYAFDRIWPRLSINGVVVFDDYGFFGCEGVTKAVNEIIADHHDMSFVHNLNGHAIFFKRGNL